MMSEMSGTGKLRCLSCGEPLRDHSLATLGHCPAPPMTKKRRDEVWAERRAGAKTGARFPSRGAYKH
jgi:hypothetical protein